jgi:MoaA/NifB/PqqE/SkfB family radical SAM enzyme
MIINPKINCLSIEPTTYCNLNCKMCFSRGFKCAKTHFLLDDFKRLLRQTRPSQEVGFVGGGEPFMNPQFVDMLREVRKYGCDWNFATNGMLLDSTTAKDLAKINFGKISFSLDAATKETYNKLRYGGDWERVLSNFRDTAAIMKASESNVMVRADFVAMKSNIHELPDFVRLAKEIGAGAINVLHVQPLTKELESEHLFFHPESQKYLDEANRLSKELKMYLIPRELNVKLTPCMAPWNEVHITAEGDIHLCCLTGTIKEKTTESFLTDYAIDPKNSFLGNIRNQDINEVFFSETYTQFRDWFLRIQQMDLNQQWDNQKYKQLRKDNADIPIYCRICGRRWGCIC